MATTLRALALAFFAILLTAASAPYPKEFTRTRHNGSCFYMTSLWVDCFGRLQRFDTRADLSLQTKEDALEEHRARRELAGRLWPERGSRRCNHNDGSHWDFEKRYGNELQLIDLDPSGGKAFK